MKRYIISTIENSNSAVKRFTEYKGHVIYYDTETDSYRVAIKNNGSNTFFSTYQEAMKAIDDKED